MVRVARSLRDAAGDRRTDIRCDVADPEAVDRALGRVLRDLGVPDIVVNNAGLFFIKRVEDTTPAEFAQTLAVNLTGPFLVARVLVRSEERRVGKECRL